MSNKIDPDEYDEFEETDEQSAARQEKLDKVRAKEYSDIQVAMSTESGRRFIYRLLIRTGLYRVSYSSDHDAQHTAFNEGGRNIGLWTLSELEQACPAAYFKMMEEARDVD